MYALLNRLTARPGKRDRAAQILLEFGELFEDNAACLLYLVAASVDDPGVIWVTDLWTSRNEHARALQQPQLRPFVAEAIPLLVRMPEQIELRPMGGKAP